MYSPALLGVSGGHGACGDSSVSGQGGSTTLSSSLFNLIAQGGSGQSQQSSSVLHSEGGCGLTVSSEGWGKARGYRCISEGIK